jgi:endo-1,4-beta-xylanase
MKLTLASTFIPLVIAAPSPNSYGKRQSNSTLGLGELATKSGLKYFGTAVDNNGLSTKQYTDIAFDKREFNQVTPTNGQKWDATEPQPNVFDYTSGDQIIDPSKKAGQLQRCHNFIWHQQLPSWLTGQTWTKQELTDIMERHIKDAAQHYSDACYAWDVVNEAFNDNGTFRSDIWSDTIGAPEYIELAFKFARQYTAPGTKLYYNDFGMETVNNKTLAVQALVKDFQQRDIPIDGVGLQAHFITGASPSYQQIRDAQALYTSLGLETALTELDVRTELPEDAEKQATQAKNYADAVKACVDEEGCVGVTVWDFWDAVSWVPGTFPGTGNATLFDVDFNKRPAYDAVAEVLKGAAK